MPSKYKPPGNDAWAAFLFPDYFKEVPYAQKQRLPANSLPDSPCLPRQKPDSRSNDPEPGFFCCPKKLRRRLKI